MVERQTAEKPAAIPSLGEFMEIFKSRGGRRPKRWLMYNPFSKFIASMYGMSRPRFNLHKETSSEGKTVKSFGESRTGNKPGFKAA